MTNKKQQPLRRKTTSPGRKPTRSRDLSRADRQLAQELDRMLELQRCREQLAAQVPEGMQSQKIEYPDGTVIFRFSHELGELGQLRITPIPAYMVPVGGCLVNYELAPGDPDTDSQWDAKFELFKQMVTICTASLPGSGVLHEPFPTLDQAKEQRRLYLRFIDCQHTDEMRAFVETLSEQQYHTLWNVCQRARSSASREDLPGILQRQEELQMRWEERA